jgi:cell wall-associated NlpC family hydrolase
MCGHYRNSSIAICSAVALFLLLGGCTTTSSYRNSAGANPRSKAPLLLSQEQADDVTIYALGLVGTPYLWGGNTPESGFDCSGLIVHVFQTRVGFVPPRTVSRLQSWGIPISRDTLHSGDIVLFAQRSEVTHAGIYVGDGRFVHAPSTGGEVRLDRLSSKYWSSQSVSFRRP